LLGGKSAEYCQVAFTKIDEMMTKPMTRTEMAGKAIAARDTVAPEFSVFVSVSDHIPSGLETKSFVVLLFFLPSSGRHALEKEGHTLNISQAQCSRFVITVYGLEVFLVIL
jgi:hypothetical protein